MSRRSKNNRRTMPPLPAAGVRPLSQDDPSSADAQRKDAAKPASGGQQGGGTNAGPGPGRVDVPPQAERPSPPPQAQASAAPPAAPASAGKSNPINMALLELQEELGDTSQATHAWGLPPEPAPAAAPAPP